MKKVEVTLHSDKTISEYNELPEGAQFSSFHFKNTTKGKENRIYISSVKITAL